MVYTVYVCYCDEETLGNVQNRLFVFADSFTSVAERVTSYYGEYNIVTMEITPFSPDSFLLFDEEDTTLFCDVKYKLEEKII